MKIEIIDFIKSILPTILIFLFLLFIFILVLEKTDKIEQTIRDCQSLGYDGVREVSAFPYKLDCYNYTRLEKLQRSRISK